MKLGLEMINSLYHNHNMYNQGVAEGYTEMIDSLYNNFLRFAEMEIDKDGNFYHFGYDVSNDKTFVEDCIKSIRGYLGRFNFKKEESCWYYRDKIKELLTELNKDWEEIVVGRTDRLATIYGLIIPTISLLLEMLILQEIIQNSEEELEIETYYEYIGGWKEKHYGQFVIGYIQGCLNATETLCD